MRITIDIDPADLQPSVKVAETHGQALVEEATDAGGPPAFLVEALGEKKEPGATSADMMNQDAGAGPAWPVDVSEEFFSFLGRPGNGAGEEGPS